MSRHFILRTTKRGVLTAASAVAQAFVLAAAAWFASIAPAHAQQAPPPPAASPAQTPPACDRACLKKTLDTYMAAVFKHDPGAAGLSADAYATENTAEVKSGERFWKAFSGYGAVNRGFFDPLNGSAAFLGVLKQIAGEDRITSVRIKVEGGKVSEAEWIVAGEGVDQGKPTPQGLIDYPPPDTPLPPAERSTRFMVKSLVSDFYQAVDDHTGEWIPSDPNCYRVENGGPPTWKWGCLGHFEAFDQRVREVSLRRYPLIDEEMGVVLCSVIFQHYPGKAGHDTLVHEYIQIRKDQVHAWWTSMYFLPPDSPTTNGWENRHWQWR